MADGQRIIHRRLSRDYSDSSDDSDDNTSQKTTKNAPATAVTSASQVTSVKVPEKNGLVLKPSLSLEPYDVAYKIGNGPLRLTKSAAAGDSQRKCQNGYHAAEGTSLVLRKLIK
ncbi:hypothetical protein AVEN_138589-1 [Araneus ventricosus]|uniref:Uncharacterized protein n=1 Tax=Araneus ventricosus TaxID=182803 RepID=A0A4Y2V469_ARAVE|nr:hypothetical protein AVEN_240008-1 [Araneus ventricosus]GBO18856.1 hypothetical protein AVEN_138589-1 [Araneus ventricosus]